MTKTILLVLAHPDDETFGMGGTIALYAQKGYNVYNVCATRGEVGAADEEFMRGFKDTAEMRTAELMRAAKILGLKEVFFLGYRDSGMPGSADNNHPDSQVSHSIDEVAGKVVRYIRELKPDVVITFNPIGGYRHPDHIHIQQATTLAFEKANDASFHPEAGPAFSRVFSTIRFSRAGSCNGQYASCPSLDVTPKNSAETETLTSPPSLWITPSMCA